MSDIERPKTICFLVGAPRSGTTWLQRLLQSHPLICGGEESQFFTLFAAPMKMADRMFGEGSQHVGPLCYINRDGFEEAIRQLWMTIFADLYRTHPDSLVHLEKSPFHARCLDEIVRIFPDAKIIFLTRDSRAVAASLVHGAHTWAGHWAPDNYRDASLTWLMHTRAALTWHQRNPDHPFLQIKYEDVIENTEATLSDILDFLLPEDVPRDVKQTLERYAQTAKQRKDPAGFARVRGKSGWRKDISLYGRFAAWRYTRKKMRELGYDISLFD